jgi:hypothetical protein
MFLLQAARSTARNSFKFAGTVIFTKCGSGLSKSFSGYSASCRHPLVNIDVQGLNAEC